MHDGAPKHLTDASRKPRGASQGQDTSTGRGSRWFLDASTLKFKVVINSVAQFGPRNER